MLRLKRLYLIINCFKEVIIEFSASTENAITRLYQGVISSYTPNGLGIFLPKASTLRQEDILKIYENIPNYKPGLGVTFKISIGLLEKAKIGFFIKIDIIKNLFKF